MLTVGLTGGIASGKSVVSSFFKGLGACVIDADLIAREVTSPFSKAWKGIVNYFGKGILEKDLTINRQRLADIVFNDPEKLVQLNNLTHPEIFREAERRIRDIQRVDSQAVIIVEAALLVEGKSWKRFDKLIVVYAPKELQIKRLVEKRGVSLEEAKRRIEAQLPIEEKIEVADFVIPNEGSLAETQKEVEKVFRKLKSS